MKKQIKSGKKRRSKPKKVMLKNIVIVGMSKFYEQIPIILPFIFSSLEEFEIKNLELKQDIQEAMDAIRKIEELESVKKSVSPAYRSYKYYVHIDKLNKIVAKKPIPIRAVFSEFAKVARRIGTSKAINKKTSLRIRLEKMNSVVEDLHKIKKFPLIKFYPDPHNDLYFPEGCMHEEGIRHYLTVGLLDYLQRLILGESCRTHQCLSCGEWFLASRANNVTCGKQLCKERYWRDARGGRNYRKEFMRSKRRKKRLAEKFKK
ncbi:MAG: hypothetical protein P9L96_03305 [Candidatus Gygaella obscura]|nr:hypothetical protein [Candidatus Gygaella obscura]